MNTITDKEKIIYKNFLIFKNILMNSTNFNIYLTFYHYNKENKRALGAERMFSLGEITSLIENIFTKFDDSNEEISEFSSSETNGFENSIEFSKLETKISIKTFEPLKCKILSKKKKFKNLLLKELIILKTILKTFIRKIIKSNKKLGKLKINNLKQKNKLFSKLTDFLFKNGNIIFISNKFLIIHFLFFSSILNNVFGFSDIMSKIGSLGGQAISAITQPNGYGMMQRQGECHCMDRMKRNLEEMQIMLKNINQMSQMMRQMGQESLPQNMGRMYMDKMVEGMQDIGDLINQFNGNNMRIQNLANPQGNPFGYPQQYGSQMMPQNYYPNNQFQSPFGYPQQHGSQMMPQNYYPNNQFQSPFGYQEPYGSQMMPQNYYPNNQFQIPFGYQQQQTMQNPPQFIPQQQHSTSNPSQPNQAGIQPPQSLAGKIIGQIGSLFKKNVPGQFSNSQIIQNNTEIINPENGESFKTNLLNVKYQPREQIEENVMHQTFYPKPFAPNPPQLRVNYYPKAEQQNFSKNHQWGPINYYVPPPPQNSPPSEEAQLQNHKVEEHYAQNNQEQYYTQNNPQIYNAPPQMIQEQQTLPQQAVNLALNSIEKLIK